MKLMIEAIENIKRNIEGIRNDEEKFHALRERLMHCILEHKEIEIKLLLRWTEMSDSMDTVIKEMKKLNEGLK